MFDAILVVLVRFTMLDLIGFSLYIFPVDDYLHSLERGRAATAKMSAFLQKSLQPLLSDD